MEGHCHPSAQRSGFAGLRRFHPEAILKTKKDVTAGATSFIRVAPVRVSASRTCRQCPTLSLVRKLKDLGRDAPKDWLRRFADVHV